MTERERTTMVPFPSDAIIPERDLGTRPVLDARHLGVEFGGLKAVDDFNMIIGRTEIAGLIGPNGAGKTTIFNLITKVYQPTTGTIPVSYTHLDVYKRQLHPTVNDALGMNDHLNAVVLHAEKPLGCHDLQRLVEQGGAVDGDFLTHDPVGMLQRLCLGGAADGGFIPRAERPAGAGQDDLVDGIARRTLQTLENGAVLAVHRQEGMLARLPGCFHHQMAAGDQCFFIGQQHPFVLKEGFQYAFQARHAHHGHQHIVAVRLCLSLIHI